MCFDVKKGISDLGVLGYPKSYCWPQHRFFPVNIVKFLRTPVLKNICERLFQRFPTWASNIASSMGIEVDFFSKTKYGNWRGNFLKSQKKTNIQNLTRWKKLTFSSCFDHFVFLYISAACRRRCLPYIVKDDRSEGI